MVCSISNVYFILQSSAWHQRQILREEARHGLLRSNISAKTRHTRAPRAPAPNWLLRRVAGAHGPPPRGTKRPACRPAGLPAVQKRARRSVAAHVWAVQHTLGPRVRVLFAAVTRQGFNMADSERGGAWQFHERVS
ncbi:MAG: hypothetical protein EOO65_03770 [Methanosarcinales archaeon]|nr:MAG: hypothetical protein EOO65_03770 [Methanosarcinales archaeon]